MYVANRMVGLAGMQLGLAATAGLLCLALLITGGLLSTNKPMPRWLLWFHRIAPFLLLAALAAAFLPVAGSGS